MSPRLQLPHPTILLGIAVIVAAALTWLLPAGEYERRDDPATGRRIVVAGTYHRLGRAPVGPFATAVAMPRGVVAAAEVITVIVFVGGAWVIVERLGTLPAVVAALVNTFAGRGLWVIPIVSLFFATMGALENMQEEIIPLIPALLVLGAGIGVDPLVVVAMSAGAAMVGSAFGPANPFQAGIALKLAQLAPLSAGALRLTMLVAALVIWIGWTMWQAVREVRSRLRADDVRLKPDATSGDTRLKPGATSQHMRLNADATDVNRASPRKHAIILAVALAPMAAYVYGALRLGWGFNELSGAFLVGGISAGLIGGLRLTETVTVFLEGMQTLLPAALLVGIARAISLVLEDGHVVDTILHALVTPLGRVSGFVAAVLMIPVQALIHIVVPSVSGQAVLTMPLFVPAADVLGLSRHVPVVAYQTGAGLMELLTPTNGALMAILLAAGVPYQRWVRFAIGPLMLLVLVGVMGIAFAP